MRKQENVIFAKSIKDMIGEISKSIPVCLIDPVSKDAMHRVSTTQVSMSHRWWEQRPT
jgi:hypothetical protein